MSLRVYFKHFSVLPDPRVEGGKKNKLMDVLFIGLATILSGETFSDMESLGKAREEWFKNIWNYPSGYRRAARSIGCLRRWMPRRSPIA